MVPVRQTAREARAGGPSEVRRHTLDARRLLCPMPLIRLQDCVAGARSGDLVEVICTDPGTRSDIPAWCRINGHRLERVDERREELVFTVRVGGADGHPP